MAVSSALRAIMLGRRPIQVGVLVGRTRRGGPARRAASTRLATRFAAAGDVAPAAASSAGIANTASSSPGVSPGSLPALSSSPMSSVRRAATCERAGRSSLSDGQGRCPRAVSPLSVEGVPLERELRERDHRFHDARDPPAFWPSGRASGRGFGRAGTKQRDAISQR
jgi:hypothetical protein